MELGEFRVTIIVSYVKSVSWGHTQLFFIFCVFIWKGSKQVGDNDETETVICVQQSSRKTNLSLPLSFIVNPPCLRCRCHSSKHLMSFSLISLSWKAEVKPYFIAVGLKAKICGSVLLSRSASPPPAAWVTAREETVKTCSDVTRQTLREAGRRTGAGTLFIIRAKTNTEGKCVGERQFTVLCVWAGKSLTFTTHTQSITNLWLCLVQYVCWFSSPSAADLDKREPLCATRWEPLGVDLKNPRR